PSILAERAERAIRALRERYSDYVSDGPVMYGGFSQGGTLAPTVIASRPGVYDTAILVEVGHTWLDAQKAVTRLKKGGVSHLIVSCSTQKCLRLAKRMDHAARESGLPFTINEAGIGRGHLFDELVFRTLGCTITRTVEGDSRWSGLAAAMHDPCTKS